MAWVQAPGGDRVGRGLGEEDALPRDENVLEPHLAVQLVEATAERREERVGMAGGHLAAEDGDARRVHRHHEGRPVARVIHSRVGADVDVLGVDRAGVHADLAAQDEAGVGLADHAKRRPLDRILAETVADGGGPRGEREEPSGPDDQVAVAGRAGKLLWRHFALEDHVADAERDEVAVPRRMGHVPRGQEGRGGIAPPHRAEIARALRRGEGPGRALPPGVERAEDDRLPLGIVVAVVPRDVLLHHGTGGGMNRHVLDEALADHPDAASVVQGFAVLAAGPHWVLLMSPRVGGSRRISYPNGPSHA